MARRNDRAGRRAKENSRGASTETPREQSQERQSRSKERAQEKPRDYSKEKVREKAGEKVRGAAKELVREKSQDRPPSRAKEQPKDNGREKLFGVTPVQQALVAKKRELHQIWIKEGSKNPRFKEIFQMAKALNIPVGEKDSTALQRMANGAHHQGIALECGPYPALDIHDLLKSGPQLLIALDQVEDPMNLGAIIRSAAFLGATGLITLKNKACPLSATVSKASAGALENFPIAQVGNLAETLEELKRNDFWVYGSILGESQPFTELPKHERLVVVMGNEGSGLRKLTQKRCDSLIHIPGMEGTESLNVSNAAAILIQHFAHLG